MAYTKRNRLLRAQLVQEKWAEYSKNNPAGDGGNTDKWIIDNILKPLHISRSTYYSYLNIPVEKQLKELEAKRKEQLKLF